MGNETLITFDIQCVDGSLCLVFFCLFTFAMTERDRMLRRTLKRTHYFKLAHHWCTSRRSKDIKQLCMTQAWLASRPFFHRFNLHLRAVNCICFQATKWQENRDEKKAPTPHHINSCEHCYNTFLQKMPEFSNVIIWFLTKWNEHRIIWFDDNNSGDTKRRRKNPNNNNSNNSQSQYLPLNEIKIKRTRSYFYDYYWTIYLFNWK